MAEELLYRSYRTNVLRQSAPDGTGPLICKRALGPGAVRRIDHERSVLRHLAGIAGIPRLAARQGRQFLTLDDHGGPTPPGLRLPVRRLVEVARRLADTVAAVHRAGVLHRDITPANLVIPESGRPLLIDFDLAVVVGDGPGGSAPPDEPLGTLGYLPPEQTGRLRRPVDRRSDLYGLGATLYALATGAAPFPGDDPLEVVRDTLVRVPPVPADRDPRIPRRLSEIITRLLAKDPDLRYQSAEALAHDLRRFDAGPGIPWRLGERDFPAVLSGPDHLIGRDDEIRRLTAALDQAQAGGGPAVLIAGPPGVGKSTLVAGLRPVVTARGGWFATGKYDQFRTGTGSGGVRRAMATVAGLLLVEPEPEMAVDRDRITAALGPNTAALAVAVPEMTSLLDSADGSFPDDPGTASGRISTALVGLLRAVGIGRPVVLVIDDLQWASDSSLRLLDAIISSGPIPGLLVVATYRDQEADAGHPLTPLAARWERDGRAAPTVRLGGLTPAGLAELVGAVLRIEQAAARDLAELIHHGSEGNPYASVELLNALRAEGLLALTDDGWHWEPDAVRTFAARHRVPQLVAAGIEQLPAETRRTLTALACLGGDTRPALLATALGMPERALVEHLAPAVAGRMVLVDRPGTPTGTIRFRHDLIQGAAHDDLAGAERDRLQLAMARRLAVDEDSRQVAAAQYLAAAGLLVEPHEQRVAATLLHTAGRCAAQLTNFQVADELFSRAAMLAAAGRLGEQAEDAIAVDRHAALYCLGRLTEADHVYQDLVGRSPDLLTLAGATATQINSLTQRGSTMAAIDLGLAVLRRLDIVPPRDLARSIEARIERLYRWFAQLGAGPRADADAETTDPRIVAAGRLIYRLLAPTRQLDRLDLYDWLVLKVQELWERHGVCAPFVGGLSSVMCVTVGLREDYRTGCLLTKYIVGVGQQHGYQAETAVARYIYLCEAAHWFEPLEDIFDAARQARDDLLAVGDVQVAGMLSYRLIAALLDGAETLEAVSDELTPHLAFAERTGGHLAALVMTGYRQLVLALQGRTAGPGSFISGDFDEAEYRSAISSLGTSRATYHANRAFAALLFDDPVTLDEYSAAAMAGVPSMRGYYVSMLARLTRAFSLTARIRAGQDDPAVVAELDRARQWLARRADDCPRNFRPLLRLVDAERAWACGDPATAAQEFDAALTEVSGRPWHRALIAERAGLFHLGQGLQYIGRHLLGEARDGYRRWGADGKVDGLEAAHPFLRNAATPPAGRGSAEADRSPQIDLMAILRASQVLSSQTTVAGLQAQVGDLLSSMTGATDAHLVLQQRETSSWYVSSIAGENRGDHATLLTGPADGDPARRERRFPMSAVRYALRTGKPLLAADATRDDRFAGDPYLAGLEMCALLVVPVPSHNVARAVLVLENRRQRGVFSTDRLETVRLIAAQLAVSLDNAILYDSLESTVKARTADLAATNRRLADSERRIRSHFEHAAVGQVIHGTDDRIETANPAFLAMIGSTAQDLAGTKLTDLFGRSYRATHRRELGAVISDRRPMISRELTLMRADGSRLDAHVTVSAVRDAEGRPDHLVSIFQDISARKAAEAARDDANLKLAGRNRELEAANQLKADLIGMLGHEINNPLATILGYVDLALDEDDPSGPIEEKLVKIRGSTRRLDNLVHEVLALVRIDAGRLVAMPRPIRVAEHIDAALAATATPDVRVSCPPDLVAAVQPSHFDHILTNLISNADKYGGGVTAIVAAPAAAGSAAGSAVTVQVHDEGPGVPPDFRGRLFDRFARAGSTAGSVPGTGLGLYIVRELARANGGEVAYHPAPGGGSIFELTLRAPAAVPS
ncbi:AAA family ATPase [Actinoplanes sp. KI2]|uniref:AAA family ATPase n=1 Tax=Actinoplanes sp. KI2 TaxID=2983315 RepID=UPI0021D5F91B|nr:AAA family ATPase [Actinoplanes sp. KI2]MCU7729112.1 AAA family ATPase [Actinoplanes sp. KI2]